MPSPYQRLADFLAAQPPETRTVTLTLPEIGDLLGQELPLSAHHATWWSATPDRYPVRFWVRVGWRVTHAQVRQAPSAITFTRVSPVTAPLVGD